MKELLFSYTRLFKNLIQWPFYLMPLVLMAFFSYYQYLSFFVVDLVLLYFLLITAFLFHRLFNLPHISADELELIELNGSKEFIFRDSQIIPALFLFFALSSVLLIFYLKYVYFYYLIFTFIIFLAYRKLPSLLSRYIAISLHLFFFILCIDDFAYSFLVFSFILVYLLVDYLKHRSKYFYYLALIPLLLRLFVYNS